MNIVKMHLRFIGALVLATAGFWTAHCMAASAQEIDEQSELALARFQQDVPGAKELLGKARAVLIFPSVIKAGIGIGGEYGEGALRIKGKSVDYYSTAAASIGFQLGAQAKSVLLVFLQDAALKKFRAGAGWEVGVDGSVALVTVGAGGQIDSTTLKEPIVAFVFGQKGLMYNLTLEGSKFTRLKR